MKESISRNLKRLIRKYEFLLEEWEDVVEISKSASQEMFREINLRKSPEIEEEDFTIEDYDITDEEKENLPEDKTLKKLFRKIVVKCHPDKLSDETSDVEKAEMLKLYDQAVKAHDDRNWALMVIVAIKLEVSLPKEAEDMVDKISEESQALEEKINDILGSVTWQYYQATEEQKEIIIENYLKALAATKGKKAREAREAKDREKLILGIGHPRTGTGYTAKLLQSWGLDVLHEKMGKHGTVDWTLSPADKSLWQPIKFDDFEWKHIIYCVRNPRDTIASLVYTEDIKPDSFNFRVQKTFMRTKDSKLFNAISSILAWDKLITAIEPDFIFRIEDESNNLFEYLKDNGVDLVYSDSIIGKPQNTRNHPNIDEILEKEIQFVPHTFRRLLNEYCQKYGYANLFD